MREIKFRVWDREKSKMVTNNGVIKDFIRCNSGLVIEDIAVCSDGTLVAGNKF